MHFDSLKDKRCYVAPTNPAGNLLVKRLLKNNISVSGMVDNFKTGDNIINSPMSLRDEDIIIVANGPRQTIICETLRKRGFKNKIFCHSNEALEFNEYRVSNLLLRLKANTQNIFQAFVKMLAKTLPRQKVLYLASGFADSNVLLLFIKHKALHPNKVRALQFDSHKTSDYFVDGSKVPLKSLWWLLTARVIIIDHELEHPFFNIIRRCVPVIQLWHGLPYKKLSGNNHLEHIEDQLFISSSKWYSKHIFPSIFRARQYLSLGYPRNDALMQNIDERCFAASLPKSGLDEFKNSCKKFIVYMPTYRDDGRDELPFCLERLDSILLSMDCKLILKLHPFVKLELGARGQCNQLPVVDRCKNIVAFPSSKDIYPWLADASMLVTDYSSVVFDFLLVDRPIVYFQHDREKYLENRGCETVVSDSNFIAGEVIHTEEEFHEVLHKICVLNEDSFRKCRKTLRTNLEINQELAIPQILQQVKSF